MDKIELKNALPEVFASRDDIRSEIWHREVTFERGHLYLVKGAVMVRGTITPWMLMSLGVSSR